MSKTLLELIDKLEIMPIGKPVRGLPKRCVNKNDSEMRKLKAAIAAQEGASK